MESDHEISDEEGSDLRLDPELVTPNYRITANYRFKAWPRIPDPEFHTEFKYFANLGKALTDAFRRNFERSKMQVREITTIEQDQVAGGYAHILLAEMAFGYIVGKVIDHILTPAGTEGGGNISDYPAA